MKPVLQELPNLHSRMTFLYLEHCRLNRDSNSITITDAAGIIHLPAACVSTLLLGPGTSVTHHAMMLIADVGITVVWVGEEGVRFYASGRAMTHSSELLQKQAESVSNVRMHVNVARMMYQFRFPEEDVSRLTMQQLRGREGSRVRKAYKTAAQKWGIDWNGRSYKPEDYSSGDDVNKALSAGNACLYGLAHAVIAALGCSAGLGFVHVGHENSFVYDIADLYKADITIPLAFEVAAGHLDDIGSEMRRRVRDKMTEMHILERMVKDIHYLLSLGNDDDGCMDEVKLWNGTGDLVANGFNFSEHADGEIDDCSDIE